MRVSLDGAVCAAMALLIIGVLRGEGSSKLVSWLSVAVLIATLVIAGLLGGERQIGFYGMFINDAFALFMKALVLLGSAVTIIMGLRYNEEHQITPRSIVKSVGDVRFATRVADARIGRPAADAGKRPVDAKEREALVKLLESQMQAAAEQLDFELAALLRDQILDLRAEQDSGRPAAPRGRAQPVR